MKMAMAIDNEYDTDSDKVTVNNNANDKVSEKADYNIQRKQVDDEQQRRHFQSWETFWGRPGILYTYIRATMQEVMKRLGILDL